MHDKSIYKVEYPDGMKEQPRANIIAENIPSQVHSEGHYYQVLTEVTYHNRDGIFIIKVDGFIKSSNGNLHRKRRTSGWKILAEWKDGSFYWFPLKEFKRY